MKHYVYLLTMTALAFVSTTAAQEGSPVECEGLDRPTGAFRGIVEAADGRILMTGSGGIYHSCDGGDTWTRPPFSNEPGLSILIDPVDPDLVYVGTYENGVDLYRDSGRSYLGKGSATPPGRIFALEGLADGSVMAGSEYGIFRTTDQGETWTLMPGSPSDTPIFSLLQNPLQPNQLFAALTGDYIHRSNDGGASWQRITSGPKPVRDVEFAPGNPSQMLAAALNGIWISSDAGFNWSRIGFLQVLDLAYDPGNRNRVYAVSREDGILRSADGGQTWTVSNDGFDAPRERLYSVEVLSSGRVLVGTEHEGLYMSDDFGASWSLAGPAEPSPPPEDEVPAEANLEVNLRYLGGDDSVPAGSRAPYRITVTNIGPDAASAIELWVSWSVQPIVGSRDYYGYTVTPSKGTCSSPGAPACTIDTLAVGESVTIEFSGETVSGRLKWYELRVNADHDGSGGGSAYAEIGSSVTIAESGAGASGLPLLLMLALCAALFRLREFRAERYILVRHA